MSSTDAASTPAAPTPGEVTEAAAGSRPARRGAGRFGLILVVVVSLLFGVPWLTFVAAGVAWPVWVTVAGTVVFAGAALTFPWLMIRGHGPKADDRAARVADTTLGVVWILFVWSVLGNVVRLGLAAGGVADPARSRITAAISAAAAVVAVTWGYVEAMRVPRVRRVDVTVPRLGPGLDGLRVVLLTDTHYGPIDRARWSRGVTEVVNTLDADLVCHVGDIADGTPVQRRDQAAPLADVRARYGRVFVTGNHEYYGKALAWIERMGELGWQWLHNRHIVVERGGDRLVVAGVDDFTAGHSGLSGHRADHAAALAGADRSLPVLLLAHQPKQITDAVAHDVDLQVSGHTHGGQIWPFHLLVRVDQPVLQGLSRHGARTQLYTSRGAGFWGPPFRVFAPSEITLLTLRSG